MSHAYYFADADELYKVGEDPEAPAFSKRPFGFKALKAKKRPFKSKFQRPIR